MSSIESMISKKCEPFLQGLEFTRQDAWDAMSDTTNVTSVGTTLNRMCKHKILKVVRTEENPHGGRRSVFKATGKKRVVIPALVRKEYKPRVTFTLLNGGHISEHSEQWRARDL
jgi:hypothetical protein